MKTQEEIRNKIISLSNLIGRKSTSPLDEEVLMFGDCAITTLEWVLGEKGEKYFDYMERHLIKNRNI